MNAQKAHAYVITTRHAVDQFIRLYTQITDALPIVPPQLNRAHYAACGCLSHLNHALNALNDYNALQHPPDTPSSHKPPGDPTTPGLEPSPHTPA